MKNISLFTIVLTLIMIGSLQAQSEWQSVNAAGVNFEYRVTEDGLNLEGIMSAQTTGWVSVGFNPTFMMRDANIIIGYDDAGIGFIRDDWGTGNTSHVADISLGGTDDVTLLDSSEIDGMTMIHFTIPLDSGDEYDQPLEIGETYPVLLARGPNGANNFTAYHAAAGNAQITLEEPLSVDDQTNFINPGEVMLSVYPNPFRQQTNIRYSLEASSEIRISIYNLRGQIVRRIVRDQASGEHEIVFHADNLPNGIYLMKFQSGDSVQSRRITILNR